MMNVTLLEEVIGEILSERYGTTITVKVNTNEGKDKSKESA